MQSRAKRRRRTRPERDSEQQQRPEMTLARGDAEPHHLPQAAD
jgi:hypothetical protein